MNCPVKFMDDDGIFKQVAVTSPETGVIMAILICDCDGPETTSIAIFDGGSPSLEEIRVGIIRDHG